MSDTLEIGETVTPARGPLGGFRDENLAGRGFDGDVMPSEKGTVIGPHPFPALSGWWIVRFENIDGAPLFVPVHPCHVVTTIGETQ